MNADDETLTFRRRNSGGRMRRESIMDVNTRRLSSLLHQTLPNWSFNSFVVESLTNNRPLFYVGLHLFEEHGLTEVFQLDHLKLMKCLDLIEESYRSRNPFHNSTHAADVMQWLHCLLSEPLLNSTLSKLEVLAAILAAAGHDVDHPGVNQTFLVSTKNYLAVLYNTSSVLENHHWRLTISLIRNSGLLDHLPLNDLVTFEETLKTMILATDISRQTEILLQFRQQREARTPEEMMESLPDRSLVLQMMLKCADISNPCRPWKLSSIWAKRCVQEFFQQGDQERHLKLPVTAICDRENSTLPKIQIGFIEHLVEPLFREWQHFMPTRLTAGFIRNLESNLARWKQLSQVRTSSDSDSDEPSQKSQGASKQQRIEDMREAVNGHLDPVVSLSILADRSEQARRSFCSSGKPQGKTWKNQSLTG